MSKHRTSTGTRKNSTEKRQHRWHGKLLLTLLPLAPNRFGTRHALSRHGACPTWLGIKWVCNKWIREGEQVAGVVLHLHIVQCSIVHYFSSDIVMPQVWRKPCPVVPQETGKL